MHDRPAGSGFARFLVRNYVELLTGLGVLFVLLTSLAPFDFGAPLPPGGHELFGRRAADLALPDVVSNLFLYVPIGILLHWSLYRLLHNTVASLLLAVGAAAALSGCVEFLQASTASRFSSSIDFVCNTIGACLGALISVRCRLIMPALARAARWEFREQPTEAVVKVYAGMLVIVAAMPFSFSLDTGMFKKSLKTVALVPFAPLVDARAQADAAHNTGDAHAYAMARWRELKCWSRWSLEFTSFAVLAWLSQGVLLTGYGFSRGAAIALVIWICGGLAVALSALQLALVTRGLDVTDILFRVMGIATGLALRARYAIYATVMSPDNMSRTYRRLAAAGCAAALAYIVYAGLIPLTLDLRGGGPERALTSSDVLPFVAYHATRFDVMMADVLEKVVAYAAFAALLVAASPAAARLDTCARTLAVTVVGVAIATLLEAAQMYIPVRVSSLTDLILAAGGSVVGVIAQEKGALFYALACAEVKDRAQKRGRRRFPPAEMSPTDALIGTLMDPRADAPAEPPQRSTPQSRRTDF